MKTLIGRALAVAIAGIGVLAGSGQACTPNDPKCANGSDSISFSYTRDYPDYYLTATPSSSQNKVFTDSFDISTIVQGWDSADNVLTATLKIFLKDDKDNICNWFEAATLTYEVGSKSWSTVWFAGLITSVNNTITTGNVAGAINDDHVLQFSLTATDGDFKIDKAVLSGRYCDYTPVPEPATMLLFGTGVAGLASLARRKN